MSRFYEIGRSNQKTFLTKNVGNDEKPKPYFMTSWPKMLNDLITMQFPLKLEHTSYILILIIKIIRESIRLKTILCISVIDCP